MSEKSEQEAVPDPGAFSWVEGAEGGGVESGSDPLGYSEQHPNAQPVVVRPAPSPTGWACPVCGRGLAPWISQCPCQLGGGRPPQVFCGNRVGGGQCGPNCLG